MKKSKANVICAVIGIVVTLALVGLAIFGIVKSNHFTENEKQRMEEALSERNNQNTENTDSNKESENTGGDLTVIPSIKEDPKLPDVKEQPNIDVGEMTRKTEAEVVGSEIEYGTKEGGSDAEQ
jgi:hypothetical protein